MHRNGEAPRLKTTFARVLKYPGTACCGAALGYGVVRLFYGLVWFDCATGAVPDSRCGAGSRC